MDHIIGNTYTTTIGNAQIGLYITGRDTVLIDTGRGESATMLAVLREHDLVPTAILNTHLERTKVLAKHVLKHGQHVLLGQQIALTYGKEIVVVIDKDAYFGRTLVESPGLLAVAGHNRVDAQTLDSMLAEHCQGREFMLGPPELPGLTGASICT